MQLISFVRAANRGFGVVVGAGIVDLTTRLGCEGVRPLLSQPALLAKAEELAASRSPDFGVEDVTLLPAVPDPAKIICVGLNFAAHAEEAGRKVGERPVIFHRFAQTLAAHGEPLLVPRVSSQFDFEGELAVIIGKGGSHIREEDAMDHVAGYAVFNDASVRDWQFHTHQYGMGKNFRSTGALGPWVVTKDQVPDYRTLTLRTLLNGEQMQTGKLSQLVHTVPALIAYVSQALPWLPGDVLATGTPSGIGFKRKPPVFMKAGDVVEIDIGPVGTLRNPIANE
jgi:2-keto-4-pentenoate hydratase/2-oxohepta-3-ene-1,7-dioic acid hydratase in catechol pathway